jgi:hypothetical protein
MPAKQIHTFSHKIKMFEAEGTHGNGQEWIDICNYESQAPAFPKKCAD